MNVIFGTAGFAKEVDWLIDDMNQAKNEKLEINYFVAEDTSTFIGKKINGKLVIRETDFFFDDRFQQARCFVAVGSPQTRKKIVRLIQQKRPEAFFPNLIHPTVCYDKRERKIKWGQGIIVCAGVTLTTDIEVLDFVQINLHSTIGHDTQIGAFSTLSPGTHISGNVHIGEGVYFGTGAVTVEKITIAPNSIIGAGAVVHKSLIESGTYIGVPVSKIN